MSHEQMPADDSYPEFDPELRSLLESIEADILESGDDNLEIRVFNDYYNNLQEVSSAQLKKSLIEYTDEDGTEYHIDSIGETPYGQLCKISRIENGENVGGGHVILCGSLVLNAQFDELTEEEKSVLAVVYSNSPDEFRPLKMRENRFAVFTKGLCEDGYFIFFSATPWDEHENPIIGDDKGYSEPERGFSITVRNYMSGKSEKFFIHESPIITEEKVRSFTVCEPQEDTVVYHYIG